MTDSIICDTSVWVYLGRVEQARLLNQLYQSVCTTETVCWELDNGRLSRPATIDPRQLQWVQIVQPSQEDISNLPPNRLGPGERSILAYARKHTLNVVGLDDRQARELAHSLGLHMIGTLGLLIKAKKSGLIKSVSPLLAKLQQEGFYISESLLEYVLQITDEA